MRRKIIQIAESTQLISLPRKWAKLHGIKKGDELEIEEQGSKLIVSTTHEGEIKKGVLDLRDQPKLKRRSICAAYLKGYDELEILYSKPEYIQIIQTVLPEFTGYEIVKQDKNSCVIKQISKPTAEEFENVFNRLWLLLHDTCQTLVDGLNKQDPDQLQSLPFREVSINKFANFCRRIVNKGGYSAAELNSSIYFILMSLEFLGDEYKDLSKYLLSEKKFDKNLASLLAQINELYENVYRVFKTHNRMKAAENALLYDKIHAQVESTFNKSKSDHIVYHHISRIMQIVIQLQEAVLLLSV
jgi:phosphate uptake regulator